MADYRATSTEFTAVADAIRTKGGTSAQFTWPNGFVSAVQAIPSGSGVVQPLSVTQNGTYNPTSGVDGYAPVTVNVSGGGGGSEWIKPMSLLSTASADIVEEFEVENIAIQNNTGAEVIGTYPSIGRDFDANKGMAIDLGSNNHDCTAYAILKTRYVYGDPSLLAIGDYYSSGGQPAFYTRNSALMATVYGGDTNVGVSSAVYHVLSISINATTKKARFFVDGEFKFEIAFSASGRYVSFNGCKVTAGTFTASQAGAILYGAAVSKCETDADIIANQNILLDHYSNYIGT